MASTSGSKSAPGKGGTTRESTAREEKNKPDPPSSKKEKNLSLEDFKILLGLMKVKLPNETLSEEAIQYSRSLNEEATAFSQDLRKSKLQFRIRPSLGSRQLKHALQLKKKDNIRELTNMIFLAHTSKPFEDKWKEFKTKSKGSFKMKDPVKEMETLKPEETTSGKKVTDHSKNQKTEKECLDFYFRQIGRENHKKYEKKQRWKVGFFFGETDYVAELDSSTSQTETVIIECKGTENTMLKSMFDNPDEPKVDLNKSHQYYYQTLSYLYMLRKTKPNADPARAVMVICCQRDPEKSEFCYGDVNSDTKEIEDLDLYLRREVLGLFLAVLNVIFEKM